MEIKSSDAVTINRTDIPNTFMMNGKKTDLSAMLLSAVRYALGRQTYIVGWTCEFIKNNLHLLEYKDIVIMIEDIKKCGYYGHDIDKLEWLKLLNVLENYIK